VGFAVVATTVVLVAVFVPIAFLQGDVGRLFSEFALTMAAAVSFSTFVALSLSPMLASKILPQDHRRASLSKGVDWVFQQVRRGYGTALRFLLRFKGVVAVLFAATLAGAVWLFQHIPQEYAPKEDRGAFFVLVNGPEGASYAYMKEYMDEIERRLLPYAESGEAIRVLVRAPRSFGGAQIFNSGIVIMVLNDFSLRRSAWVVMDEIRAKLADPPESRPSRSCARGSAPASRSRCSSSSAGAATRSLPSGVTSCSPRSRNPTPV
jgi:multidrug efflux pump